MAMSAEILCLAWSLHHAGGHLHDARKPKMETAYTSTTIRYYQAASMFRKFLQLLDVLDDQGNRHCLVDFFPVSSRLLRNPAF